MTWFKNLRRNFIDTWGDLCHEFTTHFTASRTQPKTVASLEAIVQGRSEPLRDYIERFKKEAVQVCGADENMKQYRITRGLCEGTNIKKVVPLDRLETYNQLLAIVKTYIHYEEEVYADSLNKARKEEPVAKSSRKPFHENYFAISPNFTVFSISLIFLLSSPPFPPLCPFFYKISLKRL